MINTIIAVIVNCTILLVFESKQFDISELIKIVKKYYDLYLFVK